MYYKIGLFLSVYAVMNLLGCGPQASVQSSTKSIEGIDASVFADLLSEIEDVFKPLAAANGAVLEVAGQWDDDTIGVASTQFGFDGKWVTIVTGGIARRNELSRDSFELIMLHEMGHHFGGYPFYAASVHATGTNEGAADYYSTLIGSKLLWGHQAAENALAREVVPVDIQARCDAVYDDYDGQNLCYRTIIASEALSHFSFIIHPGGQAPSIDAFDKDVVASTFDDHPNAQCRLDTYVAGALCRSTFDAQVIPGRNNPAGRNSLSSELAAGAASCMRDSVEVVGARPGCWFASLQGLKAGKPIVVSDTARPGGDILVRFPLSNTSSRRLTPESTLDLPAGLTSDTSKMDFGEVAAGSEVFAKAPTLLSISSQTPCGSMLHPEIVVDHEVGRDRARFDLRVGSLAPVEEHTSVDAFAVDTINFNQWNFAAVEAGGFIHVDVFVELEAPTGALVETLEFGLRQGDEAFVLGQGGMSNSTHYEFSYDFENQQNTGQWSFEVYNFGLTQVVIKSVTLRLSTGVCK